MKHLRDFEVLIVFGEELWLKHISCGSEIYLEDDAQLDNLISLTINHTCLEEGKPVWASDWFTGKEK